MIHYYGCTNHQWYRNIFGYALVYIPSGLKSFGLLLPAINIVVYKHKTNIEFCVSQMNFMWFCYETLCL